MLHSAEVIERSSRRRSTTHAPGVPLVVDPVMVGQGRPSPAAERGRGARCATVLLPLATLHHAQPARGGGAGRLPGRNDGRHAARRRERCWRWAPRAVLMKGGHLTGDTRGRSPVGHDGRASRFADAAHRDPAHPRHRLHAGLGDRGRPGAGDEPARTRSRAPAPMCARAIETAPGFGHGHGPLNHAVTVKVICDRGPPGPLLAAVSGAWDRRGRRPFAGLAASGISRSRG